jgi:hypothetical protein
VREIVQSQVESNIVQKWQIEESNYEVGSFVLARE